MNSAWNPRLQGQFNTGGRQVVTEGVTVTRDPGAEATCCSTDNGAVESMPQIRTAGNVSVHGHENTILSNANGFPAHNSNFPLL